MFVVMGEEIQEVLALGALILCIIGAVFFILYRIVWWFVTLFKMVKKFKESEPNPKYKSWFGEKY